MAITALTSIQTPHERERENDCCDIATLEEKGGGVFAQTNKVNGPPARAVKWKLLWHHNSD